MKSNHWHVLNGDALSHYIPDIAGEKVVLRECFIDGPIHSNFTETFWKERSKFIENIYPDGQSNYLQKSRKEIENLKRITEGDAVYLWFEDDLFCQTNFWFSIAYVRSEVDSTFSHFFLVRPDHDEWSGFGIMDQTRLLNAFENKSYLEQSHVESIEQLWYAYQANELDKMKALGQELTSVLPRLPQIVESHIERTQKGNGLTRPEQTIFNLYHNGHHNFRSIFRSFCTTEGIYGYGDLQVKNMIGNLKSKGYLKELEL